MADAEAELAEWEREYPYRDELWVARYPLLEGRTGARALPPGVSTDEALPRAQIAAAYRLEQLARAVMAGRQFTGIARYPRHTLVDNASTAADIAAIWAAEPRTADAQAFIDRALGCWHQCRARGVIVLQWDRPGYDDVTTEFDRLFDFASEPHHTPVVLAWEEAYLGEPRRGPPVPPPRYPRLPSALRFAWYAAWPVGILLFTVWGLPRVHGDVTPPPAPLPCATQLEALRAELDRAPVEGLPDDAAARAQARARLDVGDAAGAESCLRASPAWSLGLAAVHVFLYRQQCLGAR